MHLLQGIPGFNQKETTILLWLGGSNWVCLQCGCGRWCQQYSCYRRFWRCSSEETSEHRSLSSLVPGIFRAFRHSEPAWQWQMIMINDNDRIIGNLWEIIAQQQWKFCFFSVLPPFSEFFVQDLWLVRPCSTGSLGPTCQTRWSSKLRSDAEGGAEKGEKMRSQQRIYRFQLLLLVCWIAFRYMKCFIKQII